MKQPLALLSLAGRDSLDFLQRLSTNDVLKPIAGTATATVLVTEKAKIVDFVTVFQSGNETMLLLESGNSSGVEQWLNRFLFTEDVRITNASSQYEYYRLYDSGSLRILEESLKQTLPTDTKQMIGFNADGMEGYMLPDFLRQYPATHVLVKKTEAGQHLLTFLNNLPPMPNAIRIEKGIPRFGAELTDRVNPLEAGLESFINWTKGCYIGQEVIARIDTYKKLQKKLTGFFIEGLNEQNVALVTEFSGAPLFSDGTEVGSITSADWSEHFQCYVALGFLKTNVQNDHVEMKTSAGAFSAKVTSLPFRQS